MYWTRKNSVLSQLPDKSTVCVCPFLVWVKLNCNQHRASVSIFGPFLNRSQQMTLKLLLYLHHRLQLADITSWWQGQIVWPKTMPQLLFKPKELTLIYWRIFPLNWLKSKCLNALDFLPKLQTSHFVTYSISHFKLSKCKLMLARLSR